MAWSFCCAPARCWTLTSRWPGGRSTSVPLHSSSLCLVQALPGWPGRRGCGFGFTLWPWMGRVWWAVPGVHRRMLVCGRCDSLAGLPAAANGWLCVCWPSTCRAGLLTATYPGPPLASPFPQAHPRRLGAPQPAPVWRRTLCTWHPQDHAPVPPRRCQPGGVSRRPRPPPRQPPPAGAQHAVGCGLGGRQRL